MDLRKNKLYIIIAFLCVVLFGTLYLHERKSKPALRPILIADDEAVEDTPGATSEPIGKIKVYIAGEVVNPGVYEVGTGDRLDDLLQLAGGQTEHADMLAINLASYLEDAQKIIIPAKGEMIDKSIAEAQNGSEDSKLININTADHKTLTTLPGIGEVTANNIIQYREAHQGFRSVEEIKNVTRIGTVTFEKIEGLITVD